jgi:hypothetical protein
MEGEGIPASIAPYHDVHGAQRKGIGSATSDELEIIESPHEVRILWRVRATDP